MRAQTRNNPNQLSFEFSFTQLREFIRGLDAQLDGALDSMGVGSLDWNDSSQERYMFWLHIHVFQDAVNVISDTRGGKALKTEAAEWLFSEESIPFSFRSISRLLGVDPGELLEKVTERSEVRRGLAAIRH